MDLDQFEERAAILEYDEGLSRFEAETEAARRQGFKRHEVMNAIRKRDSEQGRDHGQAAARDATHNLSRVLGASSEENRPMPERDVQAGRGGLELLALRAQRRGVL